MGSWRDEVSNIQFGKNYLKTMAALHVTLSCEGLKRAKPFTRLMAIAVLTNLYLC